MLAPNFHAHPRASVYLWKFKWVSECLGPVHAQAFGARPPTYSTILALSRTLEAHPVWSRPSSRSDHELPAIERDVLQRHFGCVTKQTVLLLLHRPFFAMGAQVLRSTSTDADACYQRHLAIAQTRSQANMAVQSSPLIALRMRSSASFRTWQAKFSTRSIEYGMCGRICTTHWSVAMNCVRRKDANSICLGRTQRPPHPLPADPICKGRLRAAECRMRPFCSRCNWVRRRKNLSKLDLVQFKAVLTLTMT
jgi:hypothetical protein